MGDTVTRLDRYEPDLGLVLSADLRDTTSPLAMAQLVRRITTGDLLQSGSRERLLQWMKNTDTGPNRLRAGLPAEWSTGNKTGTGRAEGTTNKCNDVAITFPPGRPPIIIAAYFDSGEYTAQTEPGTRPSWLKWGGLPPNGPLASCAEIATEPQLRRDGRRPSPALCATSPAKRERCGKPSPGLTADLSRKRER